MRNLVAGTAGHIDHGKTSLIRALTGIDTDRLAEEKRRGITIDLGFAHLQLTPALQIGFVDVPGHERFIKNMLAGVGGIDLVLFVVAADESIKPQTREHFEICRLLGVRSGIVVVTKADLVDPELVELVKLELEDFTAGSFLEGAPMIAVSARTGAGLPELKAAMVAAAEQIAARPAEGAARLPIDRAFSVKGFGTVVTGTLRDGTVLPETEMQLYPTERTMRVRGVQVFGKSAERAEAGQRSAINLAGIEPAEIQRGMVLSEAGRFEAVTTFDCSLELLRSAKPLKHRAPVHFHTGTAEIEATVRLFNGQAAVQPGSSAWVRFVLREPTLVLLGDRYIIRMFSPVTTIGGGHVVDVSGYRYRKADVAADRLQRLDIASTEERISLLVNEAKAGLSVHRIAALVGISESAAVQHATKLKILSAEGWLIAQPALAQFRNKLKAQVSAFHKDNPLLPGLPKAALLAPATLIPELLRTSPEFVVEQDLVRLKTHRLVLQEDESAARGTIETAFQAAGLAVPALAEVLGQSGLDEKRARSIMQLLLREQRLVKVSNDLVFHSSAIAGLRQIFTVRKGTRLSVGEFKDLAGISRKYAIPLLEYADREKWTRREGDSRIVN